MLHARGATFQFSIARPLFLLAGCHAYRGDSSSLATLSGILTACIVAGKVPEFIAEFKNALKRRQDVRFPDAARVPHDMMTLVAQEQELQRKEKEQRAAEEQARVASMARDLRILRLLLALMQVTFPPRGMMRQPLAPSSSFFLPPAQPIPCS